MPLHAPQRIQRESFSAARANCVIARCPGLIGRRMRSLGLSSAAISEVDSDGFSILGRLRIERRTRYDRPLTGSRYFVVELFILASYNERKPPVWGVERHVCFD